MKRSITRWTTTLAMAAVLGLPAVGSAQSPSTTPPRTNPQPPPQQPAPEPPSKEPRTQPTPEPPTQPTPQPPAQPPTDQPARAQPPATEPATAEPRGATEPSSSVQTDQAAPEEHLRLAKAALDGIPAASVTGRATTQVAELKRHMTALTRASASAPATTGTAGASPRDKPPASAGATANWGTEVAAMDKVLTELLGTGSPSATGAESGTAGATGTTGTAGATGSAGAAGTSKNSTATGSATLDEATRARLIEVRTHITAYAAAKAGSGAPTPRGGNEASAGGAEPGAGAATAAQTSTATTETGAAATQAGATASEAAAGSTVQAQPEGQVDAEAARRALTTARDTLSQMTQLPAAAQLTGEARTQVAELISNFNELITTQVQWRASYAKVAANLDALLGPDNTGEDAAGAASSAGSAGSMTGATGAAQGTAGTTGSPAGTPAEPGVAGTSTTGSSTAGAVGTSGTATAQIDPALRAKLLDLRRNLSEFEKASGGAEK